MSRTRIWIFALLVISSAALFAASPKQMSVVVQTTQVRSGPSYLSTVLGSLAYGDRVDILETQKDWAKVSFPARKLVGWTNLSALTEKKIVLSSGSGNVQQSASSGEVALAGKGFNEQIESQYRQDGQLDYTWVDAMGRISEQPEDMAAFLKAGGLSEGGVQ
ncbi:MAG TPA: SH3 domain-containing protein [Rectinemataceae bacterium]|nr:SH3 domain-containing protein [Rectinemataceae bacterium]